MGENKLDWISKGEKPHQGNRRKSSRREGAGGTERAGLRLLEATVAGKKPSGDQTCESWINGTSVAS